MLKIISGGQTGVDRAALDVAMALGLPVGGWCPAGRLAEDGIIPDRYPLREAPSPEPGVRTALNVRDSDATLVIAPDVPSPGTACTVRCARELGRPVFQGEPDCRAFCTWLRAHDVAILNVAGPRESEASGVYDLTRELLHGLLAPIVQPQA